MNFTILVFIYRHILSNARVHCTADELGFICRHHRRLLFLCFESAYCNRLLIVSLVVFH